MRDNNFTNQLLRRLLELGCPTKHIRRLVREVADHREDLKQAALAEGLGDAGAETRADVQLGNPRALAEQLMEALRGLSWWGRHPVVAFCLLPLLTFPVLWLAGVLLAALLEFVLIRGWDSNKLQAAVSNPVTFHYLYLVFHSMDYVAIALVAVLFCWLARRSAVKFKWTLVACVICSVCAIITWAKVEPHSFAVGLAVSNYLKLQWLRGAIPLLVAFAFYIFHQRSVHTSYEKFAV